MSYATTDDYAKYGDDQIPVDKLKKALMKASDQIDSLTYNRIIAIGFDNLTQFQQTNVKKAVCEQADFVHKYGDYLDMPIQGYGAGSISMSFKSVEGGGGIKTNDAVINLLMPTGLADRRL